MTKRGSRGNANSVRAGEQFGRWTVTGPFVRVGTNNTAMFPCVCQCGTEKSVAFRTLREAKAGKIGGSCGCLQREVMSQKRKHGVGPSEPGYHRARWLWAQYKITPEQFRERLEAQNWTCAICPETLTEETGRLDHCHESLMHRGVLCHHCNVGLGHFKDDVILLAAAIRYLQQTTSKETT